MNYYGIDWSCKILIAAAIPTMGKRRVLATLMFMLSNVLAIIVACLAQPPIMATIVLDAVFIGLHGRNLWVWRKSQSRSAAERSPSEKVVERSTSPGTNSGSARP